MQTEVLNEYLFADLVVDYADAMRRERAWALKSGALETEQAASRVITSEDMKKGFERLQQHRFEALALLQESQEGAAAPSRHHPSERSLESPFR